MRLASYLCSTPQYKKKEMYIDTTQAFRPITRWDIEWFHRLHFLLDILLYSRFGFVVGALSSLRLSVMLTQITIQDSNTVIWQVTRLHVYYTTNLHVNLWTAHVFNISIFAGRRGFEPRTPASSVQCSTNWAIGPNWKCVDPKGIEPSTLSLQGRNAKPWNMQAQ